VTGPIAMVISGGQTGVDRAALDAAIAAGVPYDGWVPKGRRAEDGRVPERYVLRESDQRDYPNRTHRNVAMAGAVLVIASEMSAGTRLTWDLARRPGCVRLHVKPPLLTADVVVEFVESIAAAAGNPVRLMVAGPRGSKWAHGHALCTPPLTDAFRRLR
jgi:hypothetical protein